MKDKYVHLFNAVKNFEEIKELNKIFSEYTKPDILKLAQKKMELFDDNSTNQLDHDDDTRIASNSFGRLIPQDIIIKNNISKEFIDKLDQLLVGLLNKYKNKNENEIIAEIKNSFFNSYYNNKLNKLEDWIPTFNHDVKKEYFDIVPELKLNPPEGHQLNLPIQEIPSSIQFGISKNKIYEHNEEIELANKIIKEISEKKEYEPINFTYSKKMNLGISEQDIHDLKLKKEEEILAAFRLAGIENFNIKNIRYNNESKIQVADKVDISKYNDQFYENYKIEIEKKWHNIKKINEKIELEKIFFNVTDYQYKDFESLSGIDDIFFEIVNYAIWCSKKYISESLQETPLSKKQYYSRSYGASGKRSFTYTDIKYDDFASLEKLIESNISKDPVKDMNAKLNLINTEESFQEQILSNLKSWKNIFKKIDKNVKNDLNDFISKMSEEDKKIISWCLIFDREAVKKIYETYILKIASNIPNEQFNLKINKDEEKDYSTNGLLFDFESLFIVKKTQASLLDKFINQLKSFINKVYENIFEKITEKSLNKLCNDISNEFSKNNFTVNIGYSFYIEDIEKLKNLILKSNQRTQIKSLQNVLNSFGEKDLFENIMNNANIKEHAISVRKYDVFPNIDQVYLKNIFLSIDIFDEESIYNIIKNNLFADGYNNLEKTILNRVSGIFFGEYSNYKYFYENQKHIKDAIVVFTKSIYKILNKAYDNGDFKEYSSYIDIKNKIEEKLQEKLYGYINSYERIDYKDIFNILKYLNECYEIISSIILYVKPELSQNEEYKKELNIEITNLNKNIDEVKKTINDYSARRIMSDIYPVSRAIGGIGHKDIVSKVDKIFENINSKGISKKEIVEYIKKYIESILKNNSDASLSNEKFDLNSLASEFIKSLGMFPGFAAKIIEIFDVKDTENIIKIFINSSNLDRSNFTTNDLERALNILNIDKTNVDLKKINLFMKKIMLSSSFVHNNSGISDDFIRKIINTDNFYSNSDISQKYIEACKKYMEVGTTESIRNNTSNFSKIIDQFVLKGIITDKESFIKDIEKFEDIFNTGIGVKVNLGNKTADLKIKFLIESEQYENIFKNIETEFLDFNKLSVKQKLDILKEKIDLYEKKLAEDFLKYDTSGSMDHAMDLAKEEMKKVRNSIFDIENNSATEEQYNEDLRIRQIIFSADAKLSLLIESEAFYKYIDISDKKDERLFNLNLDIPGMKLRFRVLRYMDPYHFSVGADTNCCQKLSGGEGANAAIDSFVNKLAGVLVLESMINDYPKILSQSYFHYVPNQNGIILDNVECNYGNISNYKQMIDSNFTLDAVYASYAKYISEKLNLSYFKCGKQWNKLTNNLFTSTKMGSDPRTFKWKKYSDFSTSSHLDLLRPKFEVNIDIGNKLAMLIYKKIIKLSKLLQQDELIDLVRFI